MTTAVAKQPKTLIEYLQDDAVVGQFAAVAPRFLDPSKMARVAISVVRKTPALQRCNPVSALSAMMDSAQCGLPPDGRYAHLVPYGQECVFVPDWKGLVMLGMRSGELKRWRTDCVRANDGLVLVNGEINHVVDVKTDRGAVIGYYSQVIYKDETEDSEYLPIEDALATKKRSAAGGKGPWVTDFDEMGRKTALKRHAKRLGHVLTEEFELAIEKDGDTLPAIDIDYHEVESAPEGEATPADKANKKLAEATEKKRKAAMRKAQREAKKAAVPPTAPPEAPAVGPPAADASKEEPGEPASGARADLIKYIQRVSKMKPEEYAKLAVALLGNEKPDLYFDADDEQLQQLAHALREA